MYMCVFVRDQINDKLLVPQKDLSPDQQAQVRKVLALTDAEVDSLPAHTRAQMTQMRSQLL
jgi:hypothetical protein